MVAAENLMQKNKKKEGNLIMATFSGARVIGGQLKLRKTASQSAVVLAYIPNNTSINVSDYDDTWLSCTYNGSSGYLMRQFVDVSRSTNRTRADVFGTSTLRRGNEGRYVYNLQHYLNRHGAGLTCDGIFGGGTETAVINYQSNNGLDADGLAGANTKDSLLQRTPQ